MGYLGTEFGVGGDQGVLLFCAHGQPGLAPHSPTPPNLGRTCWPDRKAQLGTQDQEWGAVLILGEQENTFLTNNPVHIHAYIYIYIYVTAASVPSPSGVLYSLTGGEDI